MELDDSYLLDNGGHLPEYGSVSSEGDSSDTRDQSEKDQSPGISEFKVLLHLAWPIVVSTVLLDAPVLIIVSFAGHLGDTQLNAVSLAISLVMASSLFVSVGMGSACDTFFSQYHGSSSRHKMGVLLQKSLLIMLLSAIPSLAIQLNGETLLILMGQNPEEARLAGRYLLIMMPATVFSFAYVALVKFINCQNILIPPMIITGVGVVLSAAAHYALLYVPNSSIEWSAITQSLLFFLMTVVTTVYLFKSDAYKETCSGWSTECLEDWGEFVKLGLLGTVVVCVEWWCDEIILYLAGILGSRELAVQTVITQLILVTYNVVTGLGIASSIRVGNLLGAGNAQGARTSARMSLMLAAFVSVVLFVFLLSFKSLLPCIFTPDRNVTEFASALMPIIACRSIAETLSVVVQGLLTGCGRQSAITAAALSSHAASLTIGTSLMFLTPLGLYGQWLGFTAGMVLNLVIGLIVLGTTDWETRVSKALERTKSNTVQEMKEFKPSSTAPGDIKTKTELAESERRGDQPVSRGGRPRDGQTDSMTSLAETGSHHSLSRWLLFKRLCAVCAVGCVLAVGIILRYTIDIAPRNEATSVS